MDKFTKPIGYLGCPFSHPDPAVRQFRVQAATQMVFDLRSQGILAYSPLTHNFPVDRLGIYGDYLTWLEFDHSMLSRCNKLFVLKIPGWESSKGLHAEIEFAKSLKLPIEDLDPDNQFLEKVVISEIAVDPVSKLLVQIYQLIKERDWEKFHSAKNLASSLLIESAEVAEHFTWLTETQSDHLSPTTKQAVSDELGDVLINLVQLSDKLGVDLFTAATNKIAKIKEKYPIIQMHDEIVSSS